MNEHNVIEIKDLSVDFMTVRGIVYAVQGVDLSVKEGEIHGVVGESGCGKSVSTKSIMRLHDEKHTRFLYVSWARNVYKRQVTLGAISTLSPIVTV